MHLVFLCSLPYSKTGSWDNRKKLHKEQCAALKDTYGIADGEGSHLVTGSSPNFMSIRIAVGAV